MRRRILTAMIGTVVVSTLVLSGILAVLIRGREQDDAVRELLRIAARAAAQLEPDLGTSRQAIRPPSDEAEVAIGIYDDAGRLIDGRGPPTGDRLTRRRGIVPIDGIVGADHVVAEPIVVDSRRRGTIRVAEPLAEVSRRVRHDLAILALVDVTAVVVAGLVGAVMAARLTRPLAEIHDDAVRLGSGDFAVDAHHSGVPELDGIADALAETARRLDGVLQRERAFTADASHQLRTPITSMRLALDTALVLPSDDSRAIIEEVLEEMDRLDVTIDTLLSVARDRPRPREPVDVELVVEQVAERWASRFERSGRRLAVHRSGDLSAHVHRGVLDEVLDVLINNALQHGRGSVELSAERLDAHHLTITLADEGQLERDPAELFRRHDPAAGGNGLGLALARSLVEAEGGRLFLVGDSSTTTFRLILPDNLPAA